MGRTEDMKASSGAYEAFEKRNNCMRHAPAAYCVLDDIRLVHVEPILL